MLFMIDLKTKISAKSTIIFLVISVIMVLCTTGIFASSPAAFKDVPASYWGYKNIQRAYTDGVVSGTDYNEKTGERNFSPEAKLTTAEFVTILTRAFYTEEVSSSPSDANPWYAVAKEVAKEHNITNNLNWENADYPSSRYQMAEIIYNILVDKGVTLPTEAELTAAQAKIGDWDRISEERYRKPIATVVAMGIITGKDSSGSFVGADYVTRAEAATIYCRLADIIAYKDISTQSDKPDCSANVYNNENIKEKQIKDSVAVDFTGRITELVNEARKNNGLNEVLLDNELSQAALLRASECAQKFSHTRPDGTKCFTILGEMGISYSYAAENIAYGQEDADEVMNDWLNSPGHRANIMNSHVTKIGVGYIDVDGRIYWVQIFKD